MLDSDVCIDIMRRRSREDRRRLEHAVRGEFAVSSIVAAELWLGAIKSPKREWDERVVREFLALVTVLDWPATAAPIYGEIRSRLEEIGRPIGALDMLIAAHALHEDAILVTRNQKEFARVEGLKIENWSGR